MLRWNNVYYKKKTHHKMLKAPGRILWYVSKTRNQIIAVSRLDEVEQTIPKALFSEIQKIRDIGMESRAFDNMCVGDTSRTYGIEIFAHVPLSKPVSLDH